MQMISIRDEKTVLSFPFYILFYTEANEAYITKYVPILTVELIHLESKGRNCPARITLTELFVSIALHRLPVAEI